MTFRSALSVILTLALVLPPAGSATPGETVALPPLHDGDRVVRPTTALEIEIEEFLAEVFERDYFRTYVIDGREIELRMPFGMNFERSLPGWPHVVFQGGKGDPERIWRYVDEQIESEAFHDYIAELSSPGPKVVYFDMPNESYKVLTDPHLISRMREGENPSPHLAYIYFLKEDGEITAVDLYNYLYAVSKVGLDCSGLVYHISRAIAERYGVELNEIYAKPLGVEPHEVPFYVGLSFFDPESPHVVEVDDKIANLRPGDIIMFRGRGNRLIHSAVIQSINFHSGTITYYQSTDWAPLEQRGVHRSTIEFDPNRAEVRLAHEDLVWCKQVYPAFPGEPHPSYLNTDADRYRPGAVHTGGHVVRLVKIRDLLEEHEPLYYGTGTGAATGTRLHHD